MDKDERIKELELAIVNAWRQVTNENADCCAFCGEKLTAKQQEKADGQGWDYIKHSRGCIVLTIPKEAR